MIRKLILFTAILANSLPYTANLAAMDNLKSHPSKKAVRGCSPWGFFAEFLWVLNHLDWCKKTNRIPVVYWGKQSSYYSPDGYNGSTNAWEYYFEPVSQLSYSPSDRLYTNQTYPVRKQSPFSTICWYYQIIENLHLLPKDDSVAIIQIPEHDHYLERLPGINSMRGSQYPINKKHWYDPEFREYVKKQLIEPFVKIKPIVQEKIDSFFQKNMLGKKTVGIHLRGKFISDEALYVPTKYIIEEANKFASLGYQFLVSTDQLPILEEAKKSLKGNVIYYDCYRAEQTTSPSPERPANAKMGEDVLIEAQLLSKCDYFIHTLSQVSTSVLYFNPELPHLLIY